MQSGRMMPRRIWPSSIDRSMIGSPNCGKSSRLRWNSLKAATNAGPSPRADASCASRRKCCKTKLEYSTVYETGRSLFSMGDPLNLVDELLEMVATALLNLAKCGHRLRLVESLPGPRQHVGGRP